MIYRLGLKLFLFCFSSRDNQNMRGKIVNYGCLDFNEFIKNKRLPVFNVKNKHQLSILMGGFTTTNHYERLENKLLQLHFN